MHLTEQILIDIAELMASRASHVAVCEVIGISVSLLYNWRARCVADQKANNKDSPFLIPFRGERMWWTAACAYAREEFLCSGVSKIEQEMVHGIEEIVRGSDQRILYRMDPMFIGRSDTFVEFYTGCDPSEVAWHRMLHDDQGRPIPETKVSQVPASLRAKFLEKADPTYQPRTHQTVDASLDVVHVAKPLERVGHGRADLDALRELVSLSPAERRARIGARPYPVGAHGERQIPRLPPPDDPADDQGRGLRPAPPPYVPSQPTPPAEVERPSYARPTRALDQSGTGRGTP
ncbi:MAG: hypothetical protein ACREML_10385, partial [Vulcanimicrobiaceae bacterium]